MSNRYGLSRLSVYGFRKGESAERYGLYKMLLSCDSPLFYYSFFKVDRTGCGDKEIPEANKITVRKHRNSKEYGVSVEVLNCTVDGSWVLCDYIPESKITYEKDSVIYFTDVDNRSGMFSRFNGMPEMSLAQIYGSECCFYLNYFRNYGDDVFLMDEVSVHGLLVGMEQMSACDSTSLDNRPVWKTLTGIVGENYSRLYKWKSLDGNYRDETDLLDKISLLHYLETLCDQKAGNAYFNLRRGNIMLFKSMMENVGSLLQAYYLLYNVTTL